MRNAAFFCASAGLSGLSWLAQLGRSTQPQKQTAPFRMTEERGYSFKTMPCASPSASYLRSASLELRRALGVKRLDAFLEVVGLTQPAIAMPFQFDADREVGILGIVQQLLRGALRKR